MWSNVKLWTILLEAPQLSHWHILAQSVWIWWGKLPFILYLQNKGWHPKYQIAKCMTSTAFICFSAGEWGSEEFSYESQDECLSSPGWVGQIEECLHWPETPTREVRILMLQTGFVYVKMIAAIGSHKQPK